MTGTMPLPPHRAMSPEPCARENSLSWGREWCSVIAKRIVANVHIHSPSHSHALDLWGLSKWEAITLAGKSHHMLYHSGAMVRPSMRSAQIVLFMVIFLASTRRKWLSKQKSSAFFDPSIFLCDFSLGNSLERLLSPIRRWMEMGSQAFFPSLPSEIL